MTFRTIILLVVAFAIAGLTALFANNWLIAQKSSAQKVVTVEKKAPVTTVLVAATDLTAGKFVQAKHLKWRDWPKDSVTKKYIVKGTKDEKEFVGAVARTSIIAGEPITNVRLVHPGERGFLAAVLNVGSRAVSVPVNATTGIAGFVFPGDKVDMILTVKFKKDNAKGKAQTRFFSETLLTNIRVLAIDQKIENIDAKVKPLKTVTVEVTPKQAERVAIALEMGSISLSLHSLAKINDLEDKTAKASVQKSYTLDTDVYFMRQPTATRRSRAPRTVSVIRGGKSTKTAF